MSLENSMFIFPMLMRTEATTTSMTTKGRKRAKPIWNACRSSLVTKADVTTTMGISSTVSGGRERTAPGDYNWAAGSLLEER